LQRKLPAHEDEVPCRPRGPGPDAWPPCLLPSAAQAQNIAIVNGKAVPKARVEQLLQQAARAASRSRPNCRQQARDQVVLREIFVQEAKSAAWPPAPDFARRWNWRARAS
jgi:hypothetical protein